MKVSVLSANDQDREFFSKLDHDVVFDKTEDTEILAVTHVNEVTKEEIDSMNNLKLICTRSTGFDHIDLDAAKAKGIIVSNVPAYGENTVAEFTLTIILALQRKLAESIKQADTGEIDYDKIRGVDLMGQTIGIIGTGKIGYHVAKIAHGFEMNILGYDPNPNQKFVDEFGVKYVELEELIKTSDIVSLHAPSTEDNTHMIDEDTLAQMKTSAVLVNTARGELVDTSALIKALKEGKIAGAALDVSEGEGVLSFEEEADLIHSSDQTQMELALEHEVLMKMPNVVFTPHNAFNTIGALDRIRQTTAENIKDFVDGNPNNIVGG